MRALICRRYGGPEVVRVEEVPKPVPGDHEVLIRVLAAAVTSADKAARSGKPLFARLAFGLTRPKHRILGSELAGEVAAVGKGVARFKEGDSVFGATGDDFGAHADYICLPEEAALAGMPSNLTHVEAVAVSEGGLTALPFLRDWGELREDQDVLVNGASGAVGSSSVQISQALGARVTGVCSTEKVKMVQDLGAHRVVDYNQEDFTRGGGVYDLIFDAAGKSSFSLCKGSLKDGGIYLTTVPSLSILIHQPWTSMVGSRRAKINFAGLRPSEDRTRDLDFLRDLTEAGSIRPVLGRTYPLEEAGEAYRLVDTGHKAGSVVLTLD